MSRRQELAQSQKSKDPHEETEQELEGFPNQVPIHPFTIPNQEDPGLAAVGLMSASSSSDGGGASAGGV